MEISTKEQVIEEAHRRAEKSRRVVVVIRYTHTRTAQRRYGLFDSSLAGVEAGARTSERWEPLGQWSPSKGWQAAKPNGYTKVEAWFITNANGQWVFIRKVAKVLGVRPDVVRSVMRELKADGSIILQKRGVGINTQWQINPAGNGVLQ